MDTLQTLQSQIDPLFENLAKSGITPEIQATFQNAYTQTFAQFPHTGASAADQVAVADIIKKSSHFLTQEQINAMLTTVNVNINKIPNVALQGYMVACISRLGGITPAQRSALPALDMLPGKIYPMQVTRYAYKLKNQR